MYAHVFVLSLLCRVGVMTDRLDHTDPHGPHGPARTRTYRTDRTDRTDPHGSARIARTARTARTTQTRTDPHRLLGIMDCTISFNTPPLCELQKDCLTSSSCISPTHVFTSMCWKNSKVRGGTASPYPRGRRPESRRRHELATIWRPHSSEGRNSIGGDFATTVAV